MYQPQSLLTLRKSDGSELTVECSENNLIADIKRKVQAKFGIAENTQSLRSDGTLLSDGRTLTSYGLMPPYDFKVELIITSAPRFIDVWWMPLPQTTNQVPPELAPYITSEEWIQFQTELSAQRALAWQSMAGVGLRMAALMCCVVLLIGGISLFAILGTFAVLDDSGQPSEDGGIFKVAAICSIGSLAVLALFAVGVFCIARHSSMRNFSRMNDTGYLRGRLTVLPAYGYGYGYGSYGHANRYGGVILRYQLNSHEQDQCGQPQPF
mmetsp:Transcript_33986/g.62193  ORF Transcript_33986/g.62193 Transcript_33986/m.62193 type:complete len:267 (-) Transcript_33986:83-883(-)